VRTRQAFPGTVDNVKIHAAHQTGVARKSLPPGGAIRTIRERGDDVPSCGAPQALCGHPSSSCAREIRGSSTGAVSAVEMYALAKPSPSNVLRSRCPIDYKFAPHSRQTQALYGFPGSLRNHLVYPSPAPSVNKPPGRAKADRARSHWSDVHRATLFLQLPAGI